LNICILNPIECIFRICSPWRDIINGPHRLDRMEPTFLVLSITPRNLFEDKKRNQERKTRKWPKETEQKTNNDLLNKIQSNTYPTKSWGWSQMQRKRTQFLLC